jgi:nucleotide-binding universal stress UspA family protein
MSNRPSIVCPIDFSEGSQTALNYASVVADHFGARLIVLSVDDPLLASAAESAGMPPLRLETESEIRRFIAKTMSRPSASAATVDTHVRVGKPATEILRIAREEGSELIVMSSHGRSGVSKRFFGSTTERVLRETTIPVLVTPKNATPIASVSEISRHVGRIVAPVDLGSASSHQVKVAAGIAVGLGVPLLLAHVLEPVYIPARVRAAIPGVHGERRGDAEAKLRALIESAGIKGTVEALVLSGDPSEEIVRLAEARHAGLIVVGLHSSGLLGPRMGSVTYRVLCLTDSLVLAIPPVATTSARWSLASETASAG